MKYLASLNVSGTSTPDLVARRIHEAIATGELRPGDRLPAETELSVHFGIALMTVRAGLGALRDLGLLSTIRGRSGGTFVATDVAQRIAEAARRTPLTRAELRDLTDWRRAISGEACCLAATRARAEDLASIRAAADEFDGLLNQFPDLRFSDARFHGLIARVSGAAHLIRSEAEIQLTLTDVILAVQKPTGKRSLLSYSHIDLVAAIERGDGDAARSAMIRHAEDTFTWITLLL